MNKSEILGNLQMLGMTYKESKVYLTSLELGVSRVTDISKKSGILRESTYSVINSLMQKGLMSYVIKSGVRYFEAADPKKIKSILKEKEKLTNQILPSLVAIQKLKIIKPNIMVYEGKEGIKTVMEDILKSKHDILIISSNKNIRKLLEFYFPWFVKRRIKLGIKVKLLTDEKPITKQLIEFKYLPKYIEFKTSDYIYGDKVAIISLSQEVPMGIIIENKEISGTQRCIFNLIWDLSAQI